jgi:hypothetical protein
MKNSGINKITKSKQTTHCYIMKRGSYYKPNSCGYTDFPQWAGVYEKEEAVKHALCCDELTLIPINIKEHNMMIWDAINDLTSRIIEVKK